MAHVCWLGLGVMGSPMAGHLAEKSGRALTVFNRTASKALNWIERHGGQSAATPAAAARDAEFVFSCVGNDDDLRSITVGPNGAFAAMPPGAVFTDHSTTSATVARELSVEAVRRGLHFIDAPVSGGQAGAEKGMLTVMAGGSQDAFARTEPLIANYARMVRLIGPSGAGQLTKMVNQIAITGLLQSLSEAIAFAECAGLDVEAVIETISKGAAQSWQMENRWRTMHERSFDFGFAVELMRKDLAICIDESGRNGAQIETARNADRDYARIEARGGRRWDTSSLIALLDQAASKEAG